MRGQDAGFNNLLELGVPKANHATILIFKEILLLLLQVFHIISYSCSLSIFQNEGSRSPQFQEHARCPGHASWNGLGFVGQEWGEG
jgi:hypothetical protein